MSSRDAKLQLIVNADDFGKSDETVAATIECFDAGALTSATIMPGMPATESAIAFALERPELDYGVHLVFTGEAGERPVSDPELVPCLVGDDGSLLSARTVRMKALLGKLVPEQLVREIQAQVGIVLEAGVPVSHVDSHRHLHKFAPFRSALAGVLPRLGIARVRAVQDVYLKPAWRSPTYWLRNRWRAQIRRAFETTDHFFMASTTEPPWAGPLLEVLRGVGAGSIEVGVHPGREEPWRDRDRIAALELASLRDGIERVDWRTIGGSG